jgi:predicted peptidase
MNYLAAMLAGLVVLSVSVARGHERRDSFTKQITKEVHTDYLVIPPADFDAQQQYPLLIFLHGSGESGSDLDLVKIHGPFKKVAELKLPLLIVAPQTPIDEYWDIDMLSAWVDHVLEVLPVDRSRVYLTGLSLGGMGTWDLAVRRPELFAAIAPICGRGKPSQAKNLVGLGVWAFHGGKDDVVPMNGSIDMINAIYEAGGDARLTIYPDANHNSWEATYNNPKLYEWFLSHQRSDVNK